MLAGIRIWFSSVQLFSCVWLFATPRNAAHLASLPSPTPGVYSSSCPLNQWCHPANSSSVIPFSSCLQSFPAWGSFQMSQLITSGSQNIGVSASISVLPMNIQDWLPLGLTDLISWKSKELSRVCCNITVQSISSLMVSFLYSPALTSIHNYWKNHSFD